MSGEHAGTIDVDVDDEPARLVRRAGRVTWLAFGVFALLVGGSVFVVNRAVGLPVAVVVGAAVFVLGGAPAFEATATYRFATDADPDAVRAQATRPTGPFAANWIVGADVVREPAAGEAADFVLVRKRSIPFVSTREIPIRIEGAEEVLIHVDHEQMPARYRVSTASGGAETTVVLGARREGVPGYAIVAFWLNRGSVRRRFQHYGYEVREEEHSIAVPW